jgi:uncharacterized Tic20 family protein
MTQSHEPSPLPDLSRAALDPSPLPDLSRAAPDASADERSSAMLAHVLSMFIGFIGPAVIYYAKRRESRFVAFHAKQALIWHLALLLITFGGIALVMASMLAGAFVTSVPAPSKEPPAALLAGFFVIWGAIMLTWLFSMGYAVYMALQASSGRWARYPLVGRWVTKPEPAADV